MSYELLIYKPFRKQTPYHSYIKNIIDKEAIASQKALMDDAIRFKENRVPKRLLTFLRENVSPFRGEISQYQGEVQRYFPQYSAQTIKEALEFIYREKIESHQLIQEDEMVIENGSGVIRNNHKLKLEDFIYGFQSSRARNRENQDDLDQSGAYMQGSQNQSKWMNDSSSDKNRLSTSRQPLIDPKNVPPMSDKGALIAAKNERLNEILHEELNQEQAKYRPIRTILQNDPEDRMAGSMGETRSLNRRRAESLHFLEKDILYGGAQYVDTSRTDLENLNGVLSELLNQDSEGVGVDTDRSKASGSFNIKIQKSLIQSLYKASGDIKIDVLKRAVDKFRKEF